MLRSSLAAPSRRAILFLLLLVLSAAPMFASEADLKLPSFDAISIGGLGARTILGIGIIVSLLGAAFGLIINNQLKNLPVHESMREISELIYETCKTYLFTQGKFLMILEVFIGAIIVVYFGSQPEIDRKSTRLNSSHTDISRMPSSA